jgi:hypothetical protein
LSLLWLVVLGVAASAVSLYYYLQVLKQIYAGAPAPSSSWPRPDVSAQVAIVLLARLSLRSAASRICCWARSPNCSNPDMCDIRRVNGEVRPANEIVARVNTLTFRRQPGPPTMEVSVASVKHKDAGDGFWQNLQRPRGRGRRQYVH